MYLLCIQLQLQDLNHNYPIAAVHLVMGGALDVDPPVINVDRIARTGSGSDIMAKPGKSFTDVPTPPHAGFAG